MASMHPVALALLILLVVGAVGFLIHLLRRGKTFAGYQELTGDAQQIAKSLGGGEIFRDGNDLVISGNYRHMPAIVRFSYGENTPGVNLSVKAKATFTMSVVPKGESASEGRVLVRTPDDLFDARFQTRTDHPTQAKMFVGGKVVMQQLQKMCCSSRTFFTITTGAMELSELTIPTPYTGHHITDHLESMAKLSQALEDMPGAETIKVHKLEKEKSNIIRAAIVVGAIAAVITVYAATSGPRGEIPVKELADTEVPPAGMMPVDATLIRKAKDWRLVAAEDFGPNAAAWMRDNGQELTGRIPADFSGRNNQRDVAYLLVPAAGPEGAQPAASGQRRVLLLVEGTNLYDAEYTEIVGAARIPKEAIANIEWGKNPPQGTPDGDGLLIVRRSGDFASGLVLFVSDKHIVSGVPANYQQVRLR
jgi:hypothetical protein